MTPEQREVWFQKVERGQARHRYSKCRICKNKGTRMKNAYTAAFWFIAGAVVLLSVLAIKMAAALETVGLT